MKSYRRIISRSLSAPCQMRATLLPTSGGVGNYPGLSVSYPGKLALCGGTVSTEYDVGTCGLLRCLGLLGCPAEL